MNAGACVECRSTSTRLYRAEDGRFRKECGDCGHTGGPYVSNCYEKEPSGQTGLGDW